MGCRVFLHNLSLYTVGGEGEVRVEWERVGTGGEVRFWGGGWREQLHAVAFAQNPRTLYSSRERAREGAKGLAPADSTKSIHSKEGKSEGEAERVIAALARMKTGRRRDVWSALPLLHSPPLSSPDCLDFYRL